MVDLYEQGQRDYSLVKPYMDEVLDLKSRIGKLEGLLKSAHEIIKILEYKSMDSDGKMCECYFCTDDVYMKTHKSDCIVGKWLASYGKIKAE